MENNKKKQREMLSNSVLLLHDKAPPHTTKTALKIIVECEFQLPSHPLYSLDLALATFFNSPC